MEEQQRIEAPSKVTLLHIKHRWWMTKHKISITSDWTIEIEEWGRIKNYPIWYDHEEEYDEY